MSKILTRRQTLEMGILTKVSEEYREPSGVLTDAYVKACTIVVDDYTARKLVKAGAANGWRFRLHPGFIMKLWAPPKGRPVTYTLHNETLWRAALACGSGKIVQEV